MHGLPKTVQGRASLALKLIELAQYDSRLLSARIFALLFVG